MSTGPGVAQLTIRTKNALHDKEVTLSAPSSMRPQARRLAGVTLLLLPAAGLVWVPAYNRVGPALLGVPFFYWYQLAWVGLSILCLTGAALLIRLPDHHRLGGSS